MDSRNDKKEIGTPKLSADSPTWGRHQNLVTAVRRKKKERPLVAHNQFTDPAPTDDNLRAKTIEEISQEEEKLKLEQQKLEQQKQVEQELAEKKKAEEKLKQEQKPSWLSGWFGGSKHPQNNNNIISTLVSENRKEGVKPIETPIGVAGNEVIVEEKARKAEEERIAKAEAEEKARKAEEERIAKEKIAEKTKLQAFKKITEGQKTYKVSTNNVSCYITFDPAVINHMVNKPTETEMENFFIKISIEFTDTVKLRGAYITAIYEARVNQSNSYTILYTKENRSNTESVFNYVTVTIPHELSKEKKELVKEYDETNADYSIYNVFNPTEEESYTKNLGIELENVKKAVETYNYYLPQPLIPSIFLPKNELKTVDEKTLFPLAIDNQNLEEIAKILGIEGSTTIQIAKKKLDNKIEKNIAFLKERFGDKFEPLFLLINNQAQAEEEFRTKVNQQNELHTSFINNLIKGIGDLESYLTISRNATWDEDGIVKKNINDTITEHERVLNTLKKSLDESPVDQKQGMQIEIHREESIINSLKLIQEDTERSEENSKIFKRYVTRLNLEGLKVRFNIQKSYLPSNSNNKDLKSVKEAMVKTLKNEEFGNYFSELNFIKQEIIETLFAIAREYLISIWQPPENTQNDNTSYIKYNNYKDKTGKDVFFNQEKIKSFNEKFGGAGKDKNGKNNFGLLSINPSTLQILVHEDYSNLVKNYPNTPVEDIIDYAKQILINSNANWFGNARGLTLAAEKLNNAVANLNTTLGYRPVTDAETGLISKKEEGFDSTPSLKGKIGKAKNYSSSAFDNQLEILGRVKKITAPSQEVISELKNLETGFSNLLENVTNLLVAMNLQKTKDKLQKDIESASNNLEISLQMPDNPRKSIEEAKKAIIEEKLDQFALAIGGNSQTVSSTKEQLKEITDSIKEKRKAISAIYDSLRVGAGALHQFDTEYTGIIGFESKKDPTISTHAIERLQEHITSIEKVKKILLEEQNIVLEKKELEDQNIVLEKKELTVTDLIKNLDRFETELTDDIITPCLAIKTRINQLEIHKQFVSIESLSIGSIEELNNEYQKKYDAITKENENIDNTTSEFGPPELKAAIKTYLSDQKKDLAALKQSIEKNQEDQKTILLCQYFANCILNFKEWDSSNPFGNRRKVSDGKANYKILSSISPLADELLNEAHAGWDKDAEKAKNLLNALDDARKKAPKASNANAKTLHTTIANITAGKSTVSEVKTNLEKLFPKKGKGKKAQIDLEVIDVERLNKIKTRKYRNGPGLVAPAQPAIRRGNSTGNMRAAFGQNEVSPVEPKVAPVKQPQVKVEKEKTPGCFSLLFACFFKKPKAVSVEAPKERSSLRHSGS